MRAGKHRRTKHVGDDLCDSAVARRATGSDDAFGRRKPDAGEVGTRQGCHAAWGDVTIYQPAGRRTLRHAIAWTGTALPTLHEPPPTTPPHVTPSATQRHVVPQALVRLHTSGGTSVTGSPVGANRYVPGVGRYGVISGWAHNHTCHCHHLCMLVVHTTQARYVLG